ncbi:sulfite exporter TauE/SafE family protein [Oceanidesulfovibrio marinus]|uniref:Probable membrane transporter protein n=1 Tax=Oceanidesulfovibrio marinus TaxID=370038 RepID=A0A6P1ZK39_9BACT|nr:sulfite exporter TauE/SafE family protein [Oceanidesulfovibrio marinus]QJT10206.1 sulfite exporter TauE/SafE family protein [Oceanidesulfovibrio marinus]TVM35680.1 sulfite exporter TauE/SafE family protein [Oceanidesulfovibrio marinus]
MTSVTAYPVYLLLGAMVGVAASFTGLGGGFLMVPILLFMGYTAQKTVGTSLMATIIIALSAVVAHGRLGNVDYRVGLLLGVGGLVGAQLGARLVEHVDTAMFQKIFAMVLIVLAIYMFFKK